MATQTRTFLMLPSKESNIVNVTVTIPSTPAAFAGIPVNGSNTSLTLSWTQAAGKLYTIYRSNVALARDLNAASYNATGLAVNTSYIHQLRAYDPSTGLSSLPATNTASTSA